MVGKTYYEIAEKLAQFMTKEGWASPGRKNVVSTSMTLELVDKLFDLIYMELDEKQRVDIGGKIRLKKCWTNRRQEQYFIQCQDKRKGGKK